MMTQGVVWASGLHPLAIEASLYMCHDDQIRVTDEVIDRLRKSLDQLDASTELRPAVASLVHLAAHLENDRGDAASARALLSLVAGTVPGFDAEDKAAMHPIALEASLCVCGAEGKSALTPDAIEALRGSLSLATDAAELHRAIPALVHLAAHLENDRQAPDAARALLALAADYTDALKEEMEAFDALEELDEDDVAALVAESDEEETVALTTDVQAYASALVSSDANGKLSYSEKALEEIARAIGEVDDDAVADVLRSLVDLAAHLEVDRQAPEAAQALLDLAGQFAAADAPELHPFAAHAETLLEQDEEGTIFLSDEAREEIEELLGELTDDEEIEQVSDGLVALAERLEEQGSTPAAEAILELAFAGYEALETTSDAFRVEQVLVDAAMLASWDREGWPYFSGRALDAMRIQLSAIDDYEERLAAIQALVDLAAHLSEDLGQEHEAMQLLGMLSMVVPERDDAPELHPIVAQAALFVIRDAGGRTLITHQALASLSDTIAEMEDPVEQVWACRSLVDLAAHVEQDLQAPAVAAGLLEVAGQFGPGLLEIFEDEEAEELISHEVAQWAADLLTTDEDDKAGFDIEALNVLVETLSQLDDADDIYEAAFALDALADELDGDDPPPAVEQLRDLVAWLVGDDEDTGGVHPIVAQASVLISKDKGGAMTMTGEAERALGDSLAVIDDPSDLASAVRSLVALAAHLDRDLGASDVANKILTAVSRTAP